VLTDLAASANPSAVTVILSGIGAVATLAGVIVAFWQLRFQGRPSRVTRERQPPQSLDERLDQMAKSIRNSARLVEEMSAELEVRATAARELEEKAKEAEALAALNKDQAEAVQRLVDASVGSARKGIRRDSIVIGIASFVAGAGVSLLVTLLVHPIH
jgi:methyl-accepting chemotaxis protein